MIEYMSTLFERRLESGPIPDPAYSVEERLALEIELDELLAAAEIARAKRKTPQ